MCVLTSPSPFRVFQRRGFSFAQGYANSLFPARKGSAEIVLHGRTDGGIPQAVEAQLTGLGTARPPVTGWLPLDFEAAGEEFRARLHAPAGGWYVVSVRVRTSSDQWSTCECGPVGVGEVYLIAGQSYASNSNDSLLTVDDGEGRVVAFDAILNAWRIAHDPQPDGGATPPSSEAQLAEALAVRERHWSARAAGKLVASRRAFAGGSIWPPAMGLLQRTLNVPIAMVNVAVGGTSIEEWLPGTSLHDRLLAGATAAGAFRGVLWQQGESDVIAETAPATYRERFRVIRTSLDRHAGHPVDWLVAKSTSHPTVYSRPEIEAALRATIETLWREEPGVFHGPDTDHLGAFARSPRGFSQHFTREGQVVAGAMWYAALLRHLEAVDTPDPKDS